MRSFCTLALYLAGLLTLAGTVHLNEVNLRKIRKYMDSGQAVRFRRQALNNPIPWPGPPGQGIVLNVPIPTNIPFFPAVGPAAADNCPRDEIQMEDGTCQRPLSRGSCAEDEQTILDFETNRGYCAPRLCPVDRIFLPSTQLCHDPRQMNACPPGRELFYSAYGTPVCSCPDGTVESDDDLDDDVCEAILSKSVQCLYGQVFFFKDFYSPPQCVPDPCMGTNLKRSASELPFVPSEIDGICYQLGQSSGLCPYNQYYSLNYETLKGKCSTLEEAGYTVYDETTLMTLNDIYGDPIPQIPITAEGYGGNNSSHITAGILQGSQTFEQFGHSAGRGTFGGGNVIKDNQLNNQISTNTINDNQFSFGSGGIQQSNSFNQGQQLNTVIQPQQSNSFVSGQLIGHGSNQQIGQSVFVNSNVNNIQQQNAQSSFGQTGQQISGGNGKYDASAIQTSFQFSSNNQQRNQFNSQTNNQNIPNTFQQSTQLINQNHNQHIPNTFQQSSVTNNQQSFSNGNQNIYNPTSAVNNFQQSIEVFGHGSNTGQSTGFAGTDQSQGSFHDINDQQQSIEVFGQGSFSPEITGQSTGFGGTGQIQGSIQGVNNQQQSIEVFGQGSFSSQNTGQSFGFGSATPNQGSTHDFNNQQQSIEVFGQESFSPKSTGQSYGVGGTILGGQQQISVEDFGVGTGFNSPEVFGANQQQSIEVIGGNYGNKVGKSLGIKNPPIPARLAAHWHIHPNGEVQHRVPARSARSLSKYKTALSLRSMSNVPHSRKKRTPLPHASPSNVFETKLLSCQPGEARDINSKCRTTILPATIPKSRGTRGAPPIPPTPSCGQGMAFNIRRMCVATNAAQNSITAFNLG